MTTSTRRFLTDEEEVGILGWFSFALDNLRLRTLEGDIVDLVEEYNGRGMVVISMYGLHSRDAVGVVGMRVAMGVVCSHN
jgi:hypothetical protein